tara:strand:- start:2485 stop:2700 length:216 start_codon:yes stop_codon:yes gene_type:complete
MRTTLKLSNGEDESKENQRDYFVLNFCPGNWIYRQLEGEKGSRPVRLKRYIFFMWKTLRNGCTTKKLKAFS